MKASMYKIIAVTLTTIVVYLFASCEYKPDCETGDCMTVNFKGSVVVKPSGTGLNGIPVDVNFSYSKKGTTSPIYTGKIASGKTDKNGEFNLIGTIDTISVDNYSLTVTIPVQEGYINPKGIHYASVSEHFNSISDGVVQNINFEFYKKTLLTINLNRTQSDDFRAFFVYYSYAKGVFNVLARAIYDPKDSRSETLLNETAADVYTIIRWEKRLRDDTWQLSIDSLICRTNTNNVFNINF